MCLEFIEISEAKEHIDRVLVNTLILSEVVLEVVVEILDLLFVVGLVELSIDRLLQDRNILLKNGRVFKLVLIGLVEHVHVLLQELD